MGKPQKILNKWRENRPKEVRIREVKTVLNAYFPGCWEQKSGSHIVVRHESLKNIPDFGPQGEFTVPVKGGQQVKGFYLKTISLAVDIIAEQEEKK